jgi:hypothetical protein
VRAVSRAIPVCPFRPRMEGHHVEFNMGPAGRTGSPDAKGKPDPKASGQGNRTGGTSDDEWVVALHRDALKHHRSVGDADWEKVLIDFLEGVQRQGRTYHNRWANDCVDHHSRRQAR